MASWKSLQNFVYINSSLVIISITQYIITNVQYTFIPFELATIYATFVARNYSLMSFIEFGTKDKPYIDDTHNPIETYHNEFNVNVIRTTAIESITFYLIKTYMFTECLQMSMYDIIYFIPTSFAFEIIFDFFHYWTHRLLHTNSFLYVSFHKKHHKYLHPTSIITFYQDPFDLFITNSFPTVMTLLILPKISLFTFNIILIYKSYIEICGHVGKQLYPNSSFCQFIWLPRLLNIHLYTEEHDIHHSLLKCNYSKRFNFWDKLFGTHIPYIPNDE